MNRVSLTTAQKEKMLTLTAGRCAYCGKPLSVDDMTVDHISPISAGGTNKWFNMIACCVDCNKDKSDTRVLSDLKIKYVAEPWVTAWYTAQEYVSIYADRGNYELNYPEFELSIMSPLIYSIKGTYTRRKSMKNSGFGMMPVTINKAFPKEAEEISKFLLNSKENKNFASRFGCNDYAVLSLINNGEVYTVRSGDFQKLYGVIVFENVYKLKGFNVPKEVMYESAKMQTLPKWVVTCVAENHIHKYLYRFLYIQIERMIMNGQQVMLLSESYGSSVDICCRSNSSIRLASTEIEYMGDKYTLYYVEDRMFREMERVMHEVSHKLHEVYYELNDKTISLDELKGIIKKLDLKDDPFNDIYEEHYKRVQEIFGDRYVFSYNDIWNGPDDILMRNAKKKWHSAF